MKLKKNIGKLIVKGVGVITSDSLLKDPSLYKRAVARNKEFEKYFETNKVKNEASDSKN